MNSQTVLRIYRGAMSAARAFAGTIAMVLMLICFTFQNPSAHQLQVLTFSLFWAMVATVFSAFVVGAVDNKLRERGVFAR